MTDSIDGTSPAEMIEQRARLLEEKLRVLQLRRGQAEEQLRKERIGAERTGWVLLGNLMILALCAVILLRGLAGSAIGWVSLATLLVLLALTLILLILSRAASRSLTYRLGSLERELNETEQSLRSMRAAQPEDAPSESGETPEFGV
jgi:hypothetical protein